jgi:hypothetical protein
MLIEKGIPGFAVFSQCVILSALDYFIRVFQSYAVDDVGWQFIDVRYVVGEMVLILTSHFRVQTVELFLVLFDES